MKDREYTLSEKTLILIESICENATFNQENELLDKIYRLAHAGRSPSCNGAHLTWVDEIERGFEVLRQE